MTVPIPSRVSSSPVLNDTIFLDNQGNPLTGGLIFTYEGGGFTAEQATFTSSAGDTENTNPIILDSSGRMTTGLWLADGFTYNFTLCDQFGSVLESFENIVGSFGVTASGGVGTVLWNVLDVVPESVSSTSFRLNGVFVIEFAVGNRVRYQFNDLSYGYGVISGLAYSDPYTYVTIIPDAAVFSSLVINVAWSALVVTDYTADAGAIGYTNSFSYSGANVGTKLQTIDNLVTQHAKNYAAVLSGSNYTVTTGFNPTSYDNMSIDVIFDTAPAGPTTINVNNLGEVPLMQFNSDGLLADLAICDGFASRLLYNGTEMIVIDNLPYSVPPIVPTFNPTMGTVAIGGSFTVTIGTSGKVAVTVANDMHALYGNFGSGTFTLFANGTAVDTASGQFFEWDSRQGGANPVNLATVTGTPGDVITFSVTYAGSGTPVSPSRWLAITA